MNVRKGFINILFYLFLIFFIVLPLISFILTSFYKLPISIFDFSAIRNIIGTFSFSLDFGSLPAFRIPKQERFEDGQQFLNRDDLYRAIWHLQPIYPTVWVDGTRTHRVAVLPFDICTSSERNILQRGIRYFENVLPMAFSARWIPKRRQILVKSNLDLREVSINKRTISFWAEDSIITPLP